MTDARLHCEQKMIVFTDREVPLAELGSAKGGERPGIGQAPELPEGDENAGRGAPEKSRVDIAMIYCFGKPTAISRKVDPDIHRDRAAADRRLGLEDQPTATERLDYNRRTGRVLRPGPGIVYLYNRPEETSSQDPATPTAGAGRRPGAAPAARPRRATAGRSHRPRRDSRRGRRRRAVSPTSARARTGPNAPRPRRAAARPAPRASDRPRRSSARKIPPLVLMQVKFTLG